MPFQRLFTRHSVRNFSGQSKEMLMERTMNFWRQNQFAVTFPQPFLVHGEQVFTRIGLRRVVDVWIYDQGNDVAVDFTFSATLGDAEAAVGVVGAIVLLPVTAIVGAVSYLDYQSDADQLIASYWSQMGPYSVTPATPQEQVQWCKSCGAQLDLDSLFCKRCGVQAGPPPTP